MDFGDTFVKFNIFEALKHPAEDHSIFNIDAIDGLVEGYFRIGIGSANLVNFVDIFDVINKFCTETDSDNPEEAETDSDNPEEAETVSNSQMESRSGSNKKESQQVEAKFDFGHPSLLSNKVDQLTPSTQEKYLLPKHLKYAYLGDNQQFLVIIANNLSGEQEEKLLEVLRRHKKAIG
ncbi:hypothetical protein CR513_58783, partial [Mucuna pruriens]